MYILVTIFIFIFGLVLGSFVNALEYRITEDISINGRSFCPHCKHQLSVLDLVPVFSWLFLGGKCRYCKKPISVQYPVVEILSGISLTSLVYLLLPKFAPVFSTVIPAQTGVQALSFGSAAMLLIGFILIAAISTILILVALHDYKTGYVLSYYTYFAIAASLILVTFSGGHFLGWNIVLPYIYSAFGAALPFALIWAVSKGKWMGAGDIEVAFLLGILLGWPATIVGMYFAFVVGSLVAIALIVAKKTQLKAHISFGPFLIAGIYFGLAYGKQLAEMYARIFLGL